MVFLFQMKTVQREAAAFKPAETYRLDLSKAFGISDMPNVSQKATKYLEYALKSRGVELSKLTASVGGNVLNDICSQQTINKLVREYNTPAAGEKVPEFEKLPAISSKEMVAAVNALLPDPKYERLKNTVPKKN